MDTADSSGDNEGGRDICTPRLINLACMQSAVCTVITADTADTMQLSAVEAGPRVKHATPQLTLQQWTG